MVCSIAATPFANELRPYCTAITWCPSACSAGISLLKHEPSAQMPWQKMIAGLELVVIVSLLEVAVGLNQCSSIDGYCRRRPNAQKDIPPGNPDMARHMAF